MKHTLAAEWRMDWRRRGSGREASQEDSAAPRGDDGSGDQAEMGTLEGGTECREQN